MSHPSDSAIFKSFPCNKMVDKMLLTFFEASNLEQGKREYVGDIILCLLKMLYLWNCYCKTIINWNDLLKNTLMAQAL